MPAGRSPLSRRRCRHNPSESDDTAPEAPSVFDSIKSAADGTEPTSLGSDDVKADEPAAGPAPAPIGPTGHTEGGGEPGPVTDLHGRPVPAKPGVTWLRAPTDTALHVEAAAAAPQVADWVTLVAHTKGGAVFDGGTELSPDQVALRLGLALANDQQDGTPPPAKAGTEGVLTMVCHTAWQAAGDLHAVTGGAQLVLAPDGEAILQTDGNWVAGTWALGEDLESEPVANGDWVVWRDGAPYSLGTPFLREALESLGKQLSPAKNPPVRPVGFYYGATKEQTATLNGLGYSVPGTAWDGAGRADSFYTSLITVASKRLQAVLGQAPSAQLVRERVVDQFRKNQTDYREFMADGKTPDQLLDNLADPNRWDHQVANLVPHLAADAFGIDLGVLGSLGIPVAVGEATGGARPLARHR